ncbi:MBL fold metallo-hydrolase [Sphingomonas sp.]|uniref:ComEC/Rec2 family competence protein n=1 Tax=Sphingomonas sp. TaxID=28214 RepID=UPI0025E52D44|nr:MBL fold metallo-hydrolase [Sphingomonas sp.]
MEYEIEFHPVGDASKAGDAISLRYWDGTNHQIIIVDGGTDTAGEVLVEHIRLHYGADTHISHVINTHPDTDHACGLRAVLKNFSVGTLWLHGVWHHAEEMLPYFSDPRWTVGGLEKAIRKNYGVISELLDLAAEKNIPVYEPFQGTQIGPLTVLSPSRWSYLRLVPQFRKTPAANTNALEADNMLLQSGGIASWIARALAGAMSWITEDWSIELLKENPVTAAENETSTVLFGRFGDARILLTGDAGANALSWSIQFASNQGLPIFQPTLMQVPHHGSRSNVSPSVLNELLGPPQTEGSPARGVAVVSAPKDDTTHPRNMVMNAFLRRGYPVNKTQGAYYRQFSAGYPRRTNEVAAQPFEWFHQVENYD